MLQKNCRKSRIDPSTLLIENSWSNIQTKLASWQAYILWPLLLQPALLHSTLLPYLHSIWKFTLFFQNCMPSLACSFRQLHMTVVTQRVTVVAQWVTVIAQWVTVVAQWVTVVDQSGDGHSSVGDGRSSVGIQARYTLLCWWLDSCRLTQILYNKNKIIALWSTKKYRKKDFLKS